MRWHLGSQNKRTNGRNDSETTERKKIIRQNPGRFVGQFAGEGKNNGVWHG